MIYTPKQIRDLQSKLPQPMRDICGSEELIAINDNIAKTYNFSDKQRWNFGHAILFVMLGIEKKQELVKKFINELSVDENTANKLQKDTDDKIFNNLENLRQTIIKNKEFEYGKIEEDEEGTPGDAEKFVENTNFSSLNDFKKTAFGPISTKKASTGNKKIIDATLVAMRNKSKNDLPEYFQQLPKEVRNLVLDGTWEEKTREVAKKYSLDESQTDILIDKVLLILIGLASPDDFQNSITSEMFISSFLAEQLMDELGERVFAYASDQVEKKKGGQVLDTENILTSQTKEVMPETKRNMTPMVEEGEKSLPAVAVLPLEKGEAHDTTPEEKKWMDTKPPAQKVQENIPPNLPGATPVTPSSGKTRFVFDWSKKTSSEKPVEPVQKPNIGVPRYTGGGSDHQVAHGDSNIEENQNSIDQKLNTVVSSASSEPQKPKYAVDPYREPIE